MTAEHREHSQNCHVTPAIALHTTRLYAQYTLCTQIRKHEYQLLPGCCRDLDYNRHAGFLLTHEGESAEKGEAGNPVSTGVPFSALGLQVVLGMAAAVETSARNKHEVRSR